HQGAHAWHAGARHGYLAGRGRAHDAPPSGDGLQRRQPPRAALRDRARDVQHHQGGGGRQERQPERLARLRTAATAARCAMNPVRSVLICHAGDDFDREGLAAWLASFTELAGIVVLDETAAQKRARFRRELRRVGPLRFLDVVAMRFYQRLVVAAHDHAWMRQALADMRRRYGAPPAVPQIVAASVNDPEVLGFLRGIAPDLMLARCKQLLKKKLIDLPRLGCFVLHPGICPEYRNAHGCFWALAERDLDRVGMTLLKVDAGVDTGP